MCKTKKEMKWKPKTKTTACRGMPVGSSISAALRPFTSRVASVVLARPNRNNIKGVSVFMRSLGALFQAVVTDVTVGGSMANALLSTFFGALQGSISVLFTLFIGYRMARWGYMDHRTVRRVAKLNTDLFLPCLIVEQMGPGLTARRLAADWVVPLWGLASSILGHVLGYAGKRALVLPYWTIVACGRPNANVLPLLLLLKVFAFDDHHRHHRFSLARLQHLLLL